MVKQLLLVYIFISRIDLTPFEIPLTKILVVRICNPYSKSLLGDCKSPSIIVRDYKSGLTRTNYLIIQLTQGLLFFAIFNFLSYR